MLQCGQQIRQPSDIFYSFENVSRSKASELLLVFVERSFQPAAQKNRYATAMSLHRNARFFSLLASELFVELDTKDLRLHLFDGLYLLSRHRCQ